MANRNNPRVLFPVNWHITRDLDGAYAYLGFIQDLRAQLEVGERIRGVPSLVVERAGNMNFFDVHLSYTDTNNITHAINLRLRTDNLYLIGFRRENLNTWFELANQGVRNFLINEPRTPTVPVGFGENYRALASNAGRSDDLHDVVLNFDQIGWAIRTLADGTSTQRDKARALLVFVIAVAEATRFHLISRFVSSSWLSEQPEELGPSRGNLVHNWDRLSTAIQRAQNPGHWFTFLNTTGLIGTNNIAGAIDALGIMHLTCREDPRPSGSGSSGNRRSRSIPVYCQGQSLLEIFHVLLNPTDKERAYKMTLYGTITITDGAGTTNVWNRDKSKSVETDPSIYIPLNGPDRPLYAGDELYINLDLQNEHTDHVIANGTIAFNPFDYFSLTKYNVGTTCEVSGDYGSATVSYMVMSDGLYAQIAVVIIEGDGDTTQVYGDIDVNNGHGQSTLFLTQRGDAFDVKTRASIPLLKNIVAVPTKDKLTVNVNIKDWNRFLSDTQIAWGAAEFHPQYMRSESKRIKGAGGELEVQVTWL